MQSKNLYYLLPISLGIMTISAISLAAISDPSCISKASANLAVVLAIAALSHLILPISRIRTRKDLSDSLILSIFASAVVSLAALILFYINIWICELMSISLPAYATLHLAACIIAISMTAGHILSRCMQDSRYTSII